MLKFDRVRDMIHDISGAPKELITPDSTVTQLRLDSLDITELIMDIEEEFDVIIEDETSIGKVSDLLRYMELSA